MRNIILLAVFGLLATILNAQVGVNTDTIHESAMLEATSDDKGFLPPRLNQGQINALNAKGAVDGPATGLVVYNTDIPCLQANRGTKLAPEWVCLGGASQIGSPLGTITALRCNNISPLPTLTDGVDAAGITFSVPYEGGNGGTYPAQTNIQSSSVTGLNAEIAMGQFENGDGNLEFTLSGTPSGTGTAEFVLSVGGQSCPVSIPVQAAGPPQGTITALDCNSANPSSPLVAGVDAAGLTLSVPYEGGNGGTYPAQTNIQSSSVTGLNAEIAMGQFENGDGTLEFTLSGTPSGPGTANFAINIGGRTCTVSIPVGSGAVTSLGCNNVSPSGTITNGQNAMGTSFTISYSGGNGGTYPAQTNIQSSSVTGLRAEIASDQFENGNGTLRFNLSGTPDGVGTADFTINIGGRTCTVRIPVEAASPQIGGFTNCSSPNINGNSISLGNSVSGTTVTLNYTNGNGGSYSDLSFTRNGLTMSRSGQATLANGNGSITFTLSGTPNALTSSNPDVISIPIQFGGASCNVVIPIQPVQIGPLENCDDSSSLLSVNPSGLRDLFVDFSANGRELGVRFNGLESGGTYGAETVNSQGVTGLTATRSPGTFSVGASGIGTVIYRLTGTPTSTGQARFPINLGGRSCTLVVDVTGAFDAVTVRVSKSITRNGQGNITSSSTLILDNHPAAIPYTATINGVQYDYIPFNMQVNGPGDIVLGGRVAPLSCNPTGNNPNGLSCVNAPSNFTVELPDGRVIRINALAAPSLGSNVNSTRVCRSSSTNGACSVNASSFNAGNSDPCVCR